MSRLVSRLISIPIGYLGKTFDDVDSIELNYRWELKAKGETDYIEMVWNNSSLRTTPQDNKVNDSESAYSRLVKEALCVRAYLRAIIDEYDFDFKGYYLKGEKKEVFFGSLIEE